MNINFVEEKEEELVDRKNLYIDNESDLSLLLSKIQDSLDRKGFPVDRSSYKYVCGKLCKFNIELIDNIDIGLLNKRKNTLTKLKINIPKMKWDLNEDGDKYFMKIGKIQDKDLHIVVAHFFDKPSKEDLEKIKIIREKTINGEDDEHDTILEEDEDTLGEVLIPISTKTSNKSVSFSPLVSLPQKKVVKNIKPVVQKISTSSTLDTSTTSQGTTSQGTTSQGTTSQGTTSQGTTSQGTTSQGTTSQGTMKKTSINNIQSRYNRSISRSETNVFIKSQHPQVSTTQTTQTNQHPQVSTTQTTQTNQHPQVSTHTYPNPYNPYRCVYYKKDSDKKISSFRISE